MTLLYFGYIMPVLVESCRRIGHFYAKKCIYLFEIVDGWRICLRVCVFDEKSPAFRWSDLFCNREL